MSEDLLQRLKSEIEYDKISCSFSIEGRDSNGVKKFKVNSYSASKKGGGSWDPSEVPIVQALVSKQVLVATYQDALDCGAISERIFKNELASVLRAADARIERYRSAKETSDGREASTEDL